MNEPVTISVTADYIKGEKDLQVRLFLRALIKNYPEITPIEMHEILVSEASKLIAIYPDDLSQAAQGRAL